MLLNGIESHGAAVDNAVLVLDSVLYGRLDHFVELVPVLPGPDSSGHLSNKDDQEAAEELKRGKLIRLSYL